MKINRLWYILLALLALTALAIVYAFAPGQYSFYPRCFFFGITGWQCPGCGSLRATHALLHGDIHAAFAYNPLLVSLMPATAFAGLWVGFCKLTNRGLRLPVRPLCLWLLLGMGVLFAVVRNLPIEFVR
jgi:hypothetical protein